MSQRNGLYSHRRRSLSSPLSFIPTARQAGVVLACYLTPSVSFPKLLSRFSQNDNPVYHQLLTAPSQPQVHASPDSTIQNPGCFPHLSPTRHPPLLSGTNSFPQHFCIKRKRERRFSSILGTGENHLVVSYLPIFDSEMN